MIRITFTSVLSRPNLIHVSFRVAKMNLFSPSPLRGSGRKYHFCPPQADVNSVMPRQNRRKRSSFNVYVSFSQKTKLTVHNASIHSMIVVVRDYQLAQPNSRQLEGGKNDIFAPSTKQRGYSKIKSFLPPEN